MENGLSAAMCQICPTPCLLAPGEGGPCHSWINEAGRLVDQGKLVAASIEPVEKKPVYHFYPGGATYSFGLSGCNMRCAWCRNSVLTERMEKSLVPTPTPSQLVTVARQGGAQILCATFTEPLLHDTYMRAAFSAAREVGMFNLMLTSAFSSPVTWRRLLPLLDGVKVDLKAVDESGYSRYTRGSLHQVIDNLHAAFDAGVWVELSYVVGVFQEGIDHEAQELCKLLHSIASIDTPIHLLRFFPAGNFRRLPPGRLEDLSYIANALRTDGFTFVYGNITGEIPNTTVCPECYITLVERYTGFTIRNWIRNGKCPNCGQGIPGRW